MIGNGRKIFLNGRGKQLEYISRVEIILALMAKYSARFPPTTRFLVRFHAGLPLISFAVFPFFKRHSRSSDKIGPQLSNFFANRFFSSGTITRRWFRRGIFPTDTLSRHHLSWILLFVQTRWYFHRSRLRPRFRGGALSISFVIWILLSSQNLRSRARHLLLSLFLSKK